MKRIIFATGNEGKNERDPGNFKGFGCSGALNEGSGDTGGHCGGRNNF